MVVVSMDLSITMTLQDNAANETKDNDNHLYPL